MVDQVNVQKTEKNKGTCPIKVGDAFASFGEVENIIQKFEESQLIKYWRRDSRTLATARKKVKRHLNVNERLKFHELRYTCIKGGRKARSSSGLRPTPKNRVVQCGSFVQFRTSKNGQYLVVVGMSCNHNHPIDQDYQVKKRTEEMTGVNNLNKPPSLVIVDATFQEVEKTISVDVKKSQMNTNNWTLPQKLIDHPKKGPKTKIPETKIPKTKIPKTKGSGLCETDVKYILEKANLKNKLSKLKRKRAKEQIRKKKNRKISNSESTVLHDRNIKCIMDKLELIADGQKEIFKRLDQLAKCRKCRKGMNDTNSFTAHSSSISEHQDVACESLLRLSCAV